MNRFCFSAHGSAHVWHGSRLSIVAVFSPDESQILTRTMTARNAMRLFNRLAAIIRHRAVNPCDA